MSSPMTLAVASLSQTVFGPSRRIQDGAMQSNATGIIEKLVIYVWPKNVSDDNKLKTLSVLMACGRSESESPSAWATFAFSYNCLCFPEFVGKIQAVNSREYKFVPLPPLFISQATDLMETAEDYEDETPEAYLTALTRIVFPAHLPAVTLGIDTLNPDYAACQTVEVIYGYCSLILFLAGKKITEKNSVAITEKRPQNLIDAFSIHDSSAYALTGAGQMNSSAHHMINQAWSTYAGARQAIITEVAVFAAGTSLPQRVVYTVTKLLENSGMQPAYFIHRFLQAMPHAATYSCILPSLNAYVSSIREVAAAPAHLQPYYKLIHGDRTRAFHRNTLLILAACAITYEKYTSPSMNNFDLGEGATAAINMFDAEATRLGHVTLQSLTFKDESAQDAE